MQSPYDLIFEAAVKLPESDRLTLVSELLETMPPEDECISFDDSSLVEELDRRFADQADSVPWTELRGES
jgi:hypothetical protein